MIERKVFPPDSDASTRLLVVPLWLLTIYAFGLLASEAATICLWIVCAFFLFVLLDPPAEKLKRRGCPTALTAVFLVLVATVLVAFVIYILGYLFSGMLVELNQSRKLFLQLYQSLNVTWESWMAKIPGVHPTVAAPGNEVSKVELVQGSPFGGEFGATILHRLGSAVTVLTFAILVPILSFFFLAERDAFGRVITKGLSVPEKGPVIWKKIVKATRAFFVGNLILGVVTYPIFVILFVVFSVPSAFTVAALATVLNLIPFAGAVLAGFLPAMALYTQTQTMGSPLIVYGACVFIHFIIADFVTPKLLGSQVNINATTSTIALVAWGELWGGIGLILAIPITALIKILFEHSNFFWLQWIAGLMSEDVDTALRTPTLKMRKRSRNPTPTTEVS